LFDERFDKVEKFVRLANCFCLWCYC